MARKWPGTLFYIYIYLANLSSTSDPYIKPARSREEHIRCKGIAEFRWNGSGDTGKGRTSPLFSLTDARPGWDQFPFPERNAERNLQADFSLNTPTTPFHQYQKMLIPTIPAVVPRSPNSSLAPPRVITRKTSFSAALRNLALNHHWKPRTEEAVADHVAITSLNLIRPSAEFYGKEEEEGLDFWDALLSMETPPHTQIDHLLHMELLGRPLSFLERDYTPAVAASPLFSAHSLPALWVIHRLGMSKDDHTFEHTKLRKGSPIQLVDVDLTHRSLGFNTLRVFGTIESYARVEPGYVIAHLDTHLFSTTSKPAAQIAPSFVVGIPLRYIGDYEEVSAGSATIGQRCLQGRTGSAVVKRPLREWERNPGWTHPSKREIEQWYQKEQARMSEGWEACGKDLEATSEWSFV